MRALIKLKKIDWTGREVEEALELDGIIDVGVRIAQICYWL